MLALPKRTTVLYPYSKPSVHNQYRYLIRQANKRLLFHDMISFISKIYHIIGHAEVHYDHRHFDHVGHSTQ